MSRSFNSDAIREKWEEAIKRAEEQRIYNTAYDIAMKKIKKKFIVTTTIFAIVLVALSFLFIGVFIKNNDENKSIRSDLSAEIEELTRENERLQADLSLQEDKAEKYSNRLDELKDKSKEWKKKADFLDAHIVLVTEGGKKYHRYDCYHIVGKMFWAYNHEAAIGKGYEPCLDCDPPK